MAENKKSIVVYADWIDKFEELEDDEAGRLIKHFFRYVNDLNPDFPDRITKLSFIDIEKQLKRDLIKWEKKVDERSYNGRLGNIKRWNIDLYNEIILEKITLEEAENIAKHRKTSLPDEKASPRIANVAVNDNVNVNDTVNVNDIKENNNKALPFKFFDSLISLGVDKDIASDWIKVRKTKRLTNTETAFNNLKIEFEKRSESVNEIINKCVTESWGGFKANWEWKNNNLNNQKNGEIKYDRNR